MTFSRRQFMTAIGTAGTALAIPAWAQSSVADLKPITGSAVPISVVERQARLAQAQRLMKQLDIAAVLIEPGSSLTYFTGVEWWRSERLTAAVIPVEGEALLVTPFFEEPSIKETLAIPVELRVWQEDENPLALVTDWLTKRGLANRPIGIEETVRFFAVDAMRQLIPDIKIVAGAPVVRGCRLIKSPAEIALLQLSNDLQVAAYRALAPQIVKGMNQHDINAILAAAQTALGGKGDGGLVLIGESSAYPHGSKQPERVTNGTIILLDAGVSVEGYASDISRTMVFGTANKRQREVYAQMVAGQAACMKAAQIGATCGSVDDAVRALYLSYGYGPGYKLPGTSHRTGHGIGMDGHEPVNLVHGEMTKLAAGMCFSNEPGIYIPGEFGVRLEDCFHMTDAGPRYFSMPPTSLDKPFG